MTKIITQIGSLPFQNSKQAIGYSLRHDIPFLPELPLLGDNMLNYLKFPGRLSCLEDFKRLKFSKVKIPCVGPATAIMLGYSEDEAISKIYEHINKIIFNLRAEEIILFLDEPSLNQVGFNYVDMWSAIFSSFDVTSCIHCCDNADWDVLFKSDVKIISFDASKFDITIYPHYRNGKIISWGANNSGEIKDFQKGDLITLPCGMSPLAYTISDAEIYFLKLLQMRKEKNNE